MLVESKKGVSPSFFLFSIFSRVVCESVGTSGDGQLGIELEARVESKNGADASVRLSWIHTRTGTFCSIEKNRK